jgi:hypothetical protein
VLTSGIEAEGERGARLLWRMIRESGNRFSEKIMLKRNDEIMIRFNLIGS